MDHLQEKFQITLPPKNSPEEDGEGWVGFKSVRKAGAPVTLHRNNDISSASMEPFGPKYNQLPPGMEMDNQLRIRIHQQPLSLAGESDVSKDTNSESLTQGYTRREMSATDDQYTGEHVDHFYGTAFGVSESGKQVEGFVERNNYLDRE